MSNRRERRRHFLRAGITVAAAGAMWALVRHSPSSVEAATSEDALLARLCDLVIPDTDTPGARTAGVHHFISAAVAHGLAGTVRADRGQLEKELDAIAGRPFMLLNDREQATALATLDHLQFGGGADRTAVQPPSSWPGMKRLIVIGYFTSEAGAARELHYDAVPGAYLSDVRVKPGDRASGNDWVGQRFP